MQVSVDAHEDYHKNKNWILLTGPFNRHLAVCFENFNLKSSPSSRGCCSQNWVLDHRWHDCCFPYLCVHLR
uniref:Uncharacterized protein n=1 Tax=Rhizophora mucronata TaxID=61149 RepID=A0A2P2QRS0_RHIMU